MRFGLDVAQHRLEWPALVDRVRYAEDAGFDGAWLIDHFKPLYGEGPGPCLEAWTAMTGLAAATSRIRLGTLVTGMTYRHPAILATEAVTADHVSGGRIELAVGASWFEEEHRELGIDFPATRERIDRLEEGLQVIRLLLTSDDVSFSGRHYTLERATYRPRPVQKPAPPVWIGGSGERRMLPLIARLADVWHNFAGPQDHARKSAIVDRHAELAGRDPASITRANSLSLSEPWDEVRRTAEAYGRAGVSYLVCGWPTEGRARVDEFVERVMPDLTDRPA